MIKELYVLTMDYTILPTDCMEELSASTSAITVEGSLEQAMEVLGNIISLFSGIKVATKMKSKQNAISIYDTFYDKNGVRTGKALWFEDPVVCTPSIFLKYYDMTTQCERFFHVFKI